MEKLHCEATPADSICVDGHGGVNVEIRVVTHQHREGYTIFLSPKNAKTLREQLKQALTEIEAGDE